MTLSPPLRIQLLRLRFSALLPVRDEPLRRLDVRKGDHPDEDRNDRGRVGVHQRSQGQERLGVKHGRRLGQLREHQRRKHKDR